MRGGQTFQLEVYPQIPKKLARLEELAGNLRYSWDHPTRALFARLHPALWNAVGHSPKAMLKRIDEQRLVDAAADPVYLNDLARALSAYDDYLQEGPPRGEGGALASDDLIAYFCAEFGFHASLPIYSGGLGILAGDHCKAASDSRLPFVAVGLLYRQGYFNQIFDREGNQQPQYFDADFDELPIAPVLNADTTAVHVKVPMHDREIEVKLWQANIGHVRLFLLDTDLESNSEHDRSITHRLYGGDRTTRIEQEIILGVGGARALEAVGLKPTIWHINEGHAAFLILERVRVAVATGLAFDAALEAVAANTVFTTHTPVPAGHDHFPKDMTERYLACYASDMGIDNNRFMQLGQMKGSTDFNMTALAVRGSRFQNGVSRIHGTVSADLLREFWPQVPQKESPISYVTNGVHVPTFLASQWLDVFDRFLGFGWSQRLTDPATWERIDDIPDDIFWRVRQDLKTQLFHLVRHRITQQHLRNHGSPAELDRMLRFLDPENPRVLTIGFGRRFATYKRATLLFSDLNALRKIVSDPDRPVVFIFSGKAHPADIPGQELIRAIHHVARMPEFLGHILLVEGYDLQLARRMVSGADVWLNNPIYPLEASGTSGMKAGLNGVLNLSVLDGWWGEGYEGGNDKGSNGWAIKPSPEHIAPEQRDRDEAQALYSLLREQVVPTYYKVDSKGYSLEWIRMAKRSIASLLPCYSAARMVNEYVAKSYIPASRQGRAYAENGYAKALEVAAWKAKVQAAWVGVKIRIVESANSRINFGEGISVSLAVSLNGLKPEDVVVELLLTRGLRDPIEHNSRHEFATAGALEHGEVRYNLELKPELCGRLDYKIRVYPRHPALTDPMETGLMLWL